MADLKRRVEKLETEGRNITEGKGFRIIVSDAAREPLPSDDICFRGIPEEWPSWAAAAFVIQVIHLGEIPEYVTTKTERFLLEQGWRHAERRL